MTKGVGRVTVAWIAVAAALAGPSWGADPSGTGAGKLPALPEAPPELAKLPRKIARQPKYHTHDPRYCLVAFGAGAKKLVWLVLDGGVLYADRTGKGDLAAPASRIAGKNGVFRIGDILEADGKTRDKELTLRVGNATRTPGANRPADPYMLTVIAKGHFEQRAWPMFSARPADAPVVYFDGPLSLRLNDAVTLQKGPRTLLRFSISTAGVGKGSTAVVFHERVPQGISPRAELRFPTQDPEHPVVTVASINGRCCEALFNALVQVPPQAVAGNVELRLTFPDWTEGAVRGSIEEIPLK